MKRRLWIPVMTLALLAAPHIAVAQQAPDPSVADLQQAITRSGWRGVQVAPPESSQVKK